MKNSTKYNSKKKTGFFSICLMAVLAFVISCEIPEDAGSVLEIRAETNIFSHKAFINIKDLVNQDYLNGKALKAKITVLGADRPNILVTEGGNYFNAIDIIDGFASFAVNPRYRNFTDPIDLTIEIYGNDYLTKTLSITINPEDFTTEINETVLKISDVPKGVGIKQQTVTLSGGSNSVIISASTDASSDGTSADVNISANNTFKDKNGNEISSGNLSVQMVYFDGNNIDATRASINGNVGSLQDENGETLTNVILAPLATVDVNMSVGNTEVKQFSEEIDIILDINKDMINPNTGVKAAVGDEINIYSTSDNVNWTFLGKKSIYNSGGKLVIYFKTNHLSTFTAGFKIDKCTDGKATLTLPNDGVGFASVYLGFFTETVSGVKIPTIGAKIGSKLVLVNAPSKNASLTMQPYFSSGTTVVINDIAWCGSAKSSPATEGLILVGETVNLTISAKCPSGKSSIIPNEIKLSVDYNDGVGYRSVGNIINGEISIPGIILGQQYELKVSYNGESGTGTYTFNTKNEKIADYPIPGDVCTKLNL